MKSRPVDRETLLREIRTAVESAGGRRIVLKKFLAVSSIARSDVFKHYARWGDALRAAGFHPTARNTRLDPALLFADWASIVAKFRRIPTAYEYQLHGKYHVSTFYNRLGSWKKVPAAFRAFAAKKAEWKHLLAYIPSSPAEYPPRRCKPTNSNRKLALLRRPDRPACGVPLDFGPLRHAPANETGVIFLFALLAGRLGFMVEGFQAAFPDCLAKRRIGHGIWQNVTIEFEFESRNFHDHHHSIDGCDIIVCWEHNWSECPKDLEVIALREEIKRFAISSNSGNTKDDPFPPK